MIPNELQPLANHLWQSTLFVAATGLLVLAFRNNRAEIRYCLWLAASVKFLVPCSILVTLGSYFGHYSAAAPTSQGFSFIIEQLNHPFTRTIPATTVAAGQPLVTTLMPSICGAIWAIGFLILVSSWWRRWQQIRSALRTASPVRLPLGIEGMSSTEVFEPGVFGIRRPVVLLPEGITNHLTTAQLEAILRHELCHIRRGDNLAAALHMVVEALFWFHPLVWWLGKRQLDERERACDEEVLRAGTQPEVYAEAILKICELYLKSPLPCGAGVSGANLPKRIETIMNHRSLPPLHVLKSLMLVSAGVLAVSGPIVVGVLSSPLIRAQSTQTATAKFEVAAIKRCEVRGQVRGLGPTPGRLSTPCVPLVSHMRSAYIAFADGRPGPHFISSAKILRGPGLDPFRRVSN
jgi:bla regulator protein BlaR1